MKEIYKNKCIISIFSLSIGKHRFAFKIDDAFLNNREDGMVQSADFLAKLVLNKSETMIEAELTLSGHIGLVCDKSLEPFNFPLNHTHTIYYKYGVSFEELSEDVLMVPYDTHTLDFSGLIYEFMLLALPVKKLHPKFATIELTDTQDFVYSTKRNQQDETPKGDECWDKLRNMKF